MELHQLRYLRAVVRAGGVTRAAEAEHVAQPSISKQIRVLESELGTPLFHRVGRGVLPTDAGLLLAECAERMLDDLAATTSAIAGLRAAKLYEGVVLRGNLEDHPEDYTRFVLLTSTASTKPGAHKLSLVLKLPHQGGAPGSPTKPYPAGFAAARLAVIVRIFQLHPLKSTQSRSRNPSTKIDRTGSGRKTSRHRWEIR